MARNKNETTEQTEQMSKQQLAVREESQITVSGGALTVQDIVRQARLIQEVMEAVMKKDEHYGVIPGTSKPTLYQPGAQKLMLVFQLVPAFDEVTITQLPHDHREVFVKTKLTDRAGNFLGHGLGSCSTMESKYRYRKGLSFEWTEHLVPKSYFGLKNPKDKQRALAQIMDDVSGRFGIKKNPQDSQWYIIKVNSDSEEIENPNIADTFNTVLKIAKKRSLVDGVLNVTGASDIFTQDLEDLQENETALTEETGIEHAKPVSRHRETETKPEAKPEQAQASNAANPANGERTWRDVRVHVDCRVKGKTLGQLTVAHLKQLKAGWVDQLEWDSPDISPDDRRLRKGIAYGLAELSTLTTPEAATRGAQEADGAPCETTGHKPEPEKPKTVPAESFELESGAADDQIPMGDDSVKKAVGVTGQEFDAMAKASIKGNSAPAGNRAKEIIGSIRAYLNSRDIDEVVIATELTRRKLLPEGTKEILTLEEIVSPTYLTDLSENLPGMLTQWGYDLPDVSETKQPNKRKK